MKKQEFENICEKYKDSKYSIEMEESVRGCWIPYENQRFAIEQAQKLRRITVDKAIEDVTEFFQCLQGCYSGYDYFFREEKRELIEETLILSLKKRIRKTITNRQLHKLLFCALKDVINDSHFFIYVCKRETRYINTYIAYVTDLVVKKCDNGYMVVKGTSRIKVGDLLEADEIEQMILPTLYVEENVDKNGNYYLIGKYSATPVKKLIVAGKKLATHRIYSDMATQDGCDRKVEKGHYAIVNHGTYVMPWKQELIDEYYAEGVNCANKDIVVLNVTGNVGGSSDYPEAFYRGLAGIKDTGFAGAYLRRPEEIKAGANRYRIRVSADNAEESESYKGRLYVVMNNATASSAEMAVSPAFFLKNHILAGSATRGCSNFGECIMYQLPNSKICFQCGCKLFYYDGFDDGKGFLPDYWIDNVDPVGVVERYINCFPPE